MAKKAVVVDDSVTMRNMVKLAMEKAGFEVMAYTNGRETLDSLKDTAVDVFITDINMPEVDGIELIKKLRADNQYKFTPILVLTTEGGEDKKREGKAAGATGWIVKPFNPDVLLAAVKKVCGG